MAVWFEPARFRRRFTAAITQLTIAVMLTACTVGPDYQRPPAIVPAAYKEATYKEPNSPVVWQRARPADAIDRGAWWSVYRDPVLDGLERQIDVSNQNLRASEAAFRQAEALVTQARASFFPTLTTSSQAQRSRSGGVISSSSGGTFSAPRGANISNFFSMNEAASWAPDVWGKIRRTVEGDVASAQASAGDLASARLAAQGALASDYMQLRVADELKRLLDRTVVAFTESLRIVQNQYNAGIAAASDVAQAQTQLENARAQAIAVGVTRAQLEHAIAVLIGKPPAALTIEPVETVAGIPDIPVDVPSALLERRPDIAAAERRMAAANAQIGGLEAAFFPTITLTGNSGVQSSMIRHLLSEASRVWSFGANVSELVFDAGSRQAQVMQARYAYDEAIANYRQTVLSSFQQIEDQLAALRVLAQQAVAAEAAVKAAREAERIIFNQYKAGTVAYTNVVVAQTAALSNAETALNVLQSRLVASVALVQALGGGWDVSQIPSRDQIETDSPMNFNPLPPPDTNPRFFDITSWF
jgi:NodT family efflux transporter outer membrane factor (OMF) lipoprotein